MKITKLTFVRKTLFQGKRKVGIDSNTIINVIDNKVLFRDTLQQLKDEKILFIHEESEKEVPKILIEEYNYSENEAKTEFERFKKEYNIVVVKKNRSNPLLSSLYEDCKGIHPPDSWILADFKAEGINKVYSGDNKFLEGARILGMDATKTLSLDAELKKQLRNMFKVRRK
jgi:predicted nucleic acid-binding protein